MTVVRVKVLFFGVLKDISGVSEQELDVAEGSRIESVFEHYAERRPKLRELSASIVAARNHRFAARDEAVETGDEIAFLPPVSGGAGAYTHEIAGPEGHFFALTREPVDGRTIGARLLQRLDGALVNFEGVVRDNTKGRATRYLDYECYEPMAIRVMAEIGRELARSYAISRIAMVHRLGRMEVGETSVAVVVTAPHRRPAFEAALEGINRLKRLAPIWKKEYFVDGEVWV
jgi:molybdopterin synthase catalytic subunit